MNTRHPLSVIVAVLALGAAGAAQAKLATNGTELDGVAAEARVPQGRGLARPGVLDGAKRPAQLNGSSSEGRPLYLVEPRFDHLPASLPAAAR